MADAVDPAERIEALLSTAEPRIARAFQAAIDALGDELDLAKVEQLLAAGDVEGALNLVQQVADRVGEASAVTFVSAGQDTARFLSGLDLGTIIFNQVNVRAVQAMQLNNLELVRQFSSEQRRATHIALLDGIARGLNPVDQARNFRDSVGLTERQQAAVVNYRRLLLGDAADQREALTRELRDRRHDRTVQRSIRTSEPLTPAQVELMVDRYRKRYIKHRAIVIGRTEALRSVNQGVEEGYAQAIAAGVLDAADLVRTWDSSRDGRVRNTHRALHGQKRDWGASWQTPNGILRYPGDPAAPAEEVIQCRCVVTTRIKGAGVRAKPRKAVTEADVTGKGWDVRADAEGLDLWNKVLKRDPVEFFDSMVGPAMKAVPVVGLSGTLYPPLAKFSRLADNHYETKMETGLASVRQPGTMLGKLERTLTYKDGRLTVYHDLLALKDEAQGAGLGTAALASQFKTYREMGVAQISVTAALDKGGYVWAKFGFVPSQSAWDRVRAKSSNRLYQLKQDGKISDDDFTVASALLNNADPKSIWDLSDLSKEVAPNQKLGYHLLEQLAWAGKLDMSDAEATGRFEAYINRKPKK